ncbi:MAG: ribosome maturation factor RimP [Actinomycetia bacterium]|nr:ribosome maturation factor RimP [Actinomycetes bacterium]
MSETQTLDKVRALVTPIVGDLQLDLYDLEFRGGTLRVVLDTPVGSAAGVDLDTIALATRLIGREFDHHDPVPGHYTLEVTSPGLERTLRTPAHFQRELGKVVALRLRDTTNADRRVQGVLSAADEQAATISPEDGSEARTVKYDQIDRARTVFTWGPSPKPGGKKAKTGSPTTSPAINKEQAR